MKLICLGTCGYYPTDTMHTACYAIPELGIVFDAGSGLYRVSDYIKSETLHIFLSHGHFDHIQGLNMAKMLLRTTVKKIIVHAFPNVIESIKTIFNEPFNGSKGIVPFDFEVVDKDSIIKLDNGAKIQTFPLKHTSPCIGYRLDYQNHSIAYVTDTSTEKDAVYIPIVASSNLLLHECYYPSSGAELAVTQGHTSADRLVETLKLMKRDNVVVVHHNPIGGKDEVLSELKNAGIDAHLATERGEFEF